MDAIQTFKIFQQELVTAFRFLAERNHDQYSEHLALAHRQLRLGRSKLSKRDTELLYKCAERSIDVLKKCHSLGLKNLSKRLAEYRLDQVLAVLLDTRSSKERTKIESQEYLLAA